MSYNRAIQLQIIEELKVKPEISPQEEVDARITFLRNFLQTSGLKGYVLGLSGGQDSTLSGKLAQLAMEKDNKFIAVRLPYGVQRDAADVDEAIEFIKPTEVYDFNIKSTVDALCLEYEKVLGTPLPDYHKGNVKARVRMVVQYAIAGARNMAVIGTDHASENVTRFFTKHGDGAADILPLFGISKFQGREMLKTFPDCPERAYTKVPTPDLRDDQPGMRDEAELGCSYQDIEDFLTGKEVTDEVFDIIYSFYCKGTHKTKPPITIYD